MKKELEAIVFDIDGVLLDHEYEDKHNWLDKIEHDLNISRDLIENLHKNAQRWKELSLGNDRVEKYFKEFVDNNNITRVSYLQLLNYFINNDTFSRNYMFEEVEKLKNKGYKLYIGTHQVPEKGERLWFVEDFKKYFIKMFTSYDVGFLKSNIGFFDKISNELGIEKNKIMLIDDKQKNVDTAIQAGWQGYTYKTFDDIKKNLFDNL